MKICQQAVNFKKRKNNETCERRKFTGFMIKLKIFLGGFLISFVL
jgi:hypothetical protein